MKRRFGVPRGLAPDVSSLWRMIQGSRTGVILETGQTQRNRWWRMVKDGGGLWRMVEDGGGWWRIVEDGGGFLEDDGGWWRILEDGGG